MFASIFPKGRDWGGAGAVDEDSGEPRELGEMVTGGRSLSPAAESGPCFLGHWELLLLFSFSFLVLLVLAARQGGGQGVWK